MFSEQTIYIQIEKDLFKILHVQSGRTSKIQGTFSNQRLAIAHFKVAAEALKKGVFDVYPKSFLRILPVIVMFWSNGNGHFNERHYNLSSLR